MIEKKYIKIYRGTVLKEKEAIVSLRISQIYSQMLEDLQDFFSFFSSFAKSNIHI